MFSTLRKHMRVSPAGTIATLALILAMSGGAYAASKYVITSTKQIKPSVLKSLQGKTGPAGAPGSAGPAGAQGAQGAQGPAGPAGPQGTPGGKGETGSQGTKGTTGTIGATGSKGATGATGTTGYTETLPAGKTETGTWVLQATNGGKDEAKLMAISFPIPLSEPVEGPNGKIIFVKLNEATPAGCKGSVTEPGAEPDTLCIFEGSSLLPAKPGLVPHPITAAPGVAGDEKAGRTGAEVIFTTEEPTTAGEEIAARGTWAVTAR